ncbi:hypothetical protein A1O1_06958 [Capronia coronata CBS 617.96]|uniref:Uncharacterized protein n=1 Tax=Capronia coronata CBS 617.96 TaxID=1182541 RepID=W9XS36_9EURO|nr:uncharacterized protein A1O1_06958 [Capronia coronata CBS 617.96]EXJ83337.1 hypothetical protein A1O1_06958 [Capronia coronata CBS 617.96]
MMSAETATVVIFATSGHGNWYIAVLEIRRLLQKAGSICQIRILDSRRIYTFPLDPSTDKMLIEHFYASLEHSVATELRESGLRWTSFTITRRGFEADRESCQPVLTITALDPDSPQWWNAILPRLRGVEHGLDVELRYGKLELLTSQEEIDSVDRLHPDAWGNGMVMGASCGYQTAETTGTIGISLTLRDKQGEESLFGLSCHHVVATPEITRAVEDKPLNAAKCGVMVMSPSDGDHKITAQVINNEVKIAQNVLDAKSAKAFVESSAETLNAINEGKERTMENRICSSTLRDYANSGGEVIKEVDTYAAPRTIEGHPPVIKHGRSTGWTTGRLNPVVTVWNSEFMMGYYGREKSMWTWTAVSCPAKSICQPGDSGAMIIDNGEYAGRFLGHLFAQTTGFPELGHFIPLHLTFQDVEETTGFTVISLKLNL